MQNKPYFFFWKQGFPKGGEGGGGPTLGKNSQKIPFFFFDSVPKHPSQHIKVRYHLSCGVKDNVTQKSICYAQLLQEQLTICRFHSVAYFHFSCSYVLSN